MFAMQLKKIPYILFAIFYLTLSTHLSASIHFCGGSITSISFFEHNADDNCECNKMSDKSCCNDLNFQFKTNENSTNSLKQISFNFTQKFNKLILSFYQKVYSINEVYKTQTFYIFDKKPPYNLLHLNAIFLLI
jgi:hypothetical protein